VTATPPDRPYREIRARYDDRSITVYQAYPPEIAGPALAAGTFVPPFKAERMTWIKPSFRWMMYRSGWATKPGQERVLAVDITRDGFDWAMSRSRPTDGTAGDTPVLVQWDPERSLSLQPLPYRAVQIGLRGEAVRRYLGDWIITIRDVTPLAHEIHALVRAGDTARADALRPTERPYPDPTTADQPAR
jgi:Domain of unknown function (DUF4291)